MNIVQYETVGALKDGEVFEWNVPGWILNHKYSTKRSELFTLNRILDFKFCLTLRPYTDISTKSVSFNLQLHSIPIFDCDSGPIAQTSDHALFEMDVRFLLYKQNSIYRWSCSMKMQDNRLTADFPEITPYDSLTIQCIMMSTIPVPQLEMNPSINITRQEATAEINENPHTLVQDMEELLNSGSLSDVTLSVDDKEFNVHRCILASRSKVFAAMFSHDTQEKRQNRIVIVDFSSDTIHQILKYIYTNKIDELTPEQYLSLFSAADKYAITDLRKKCSQHLQINLPFNFVIHVLIAADLHQDDVLKKVATQIFLKNAVSVMESEEWLPFMKNHAELASSILLHLAKKSHSSAVNN